jgi:GTPase involved in cell partitioning and DNA repair
LDDGGLIFPNNVIRNELKEYSSELATKKEIIVITKSDTTEDVKKYKNSISVSIYDADSIENLKNILIENK